jgi:hypothetical protein
MIAAAAPTTNRMATLAESMPDRGNLRANSDEYARKDLFLRALMPRDGPDGWERGMV